MKPRSKEFILWFNEIDMGDVNYVGGKNASLGEMYRNLTKKGVRVPNGFAVAAYAYRYVLEKSGVFSKLKSVLRGVNIKNVKSLAEAGHKARELILRADFPPDLRLAIADAYKKLCKQYRTNDLDVAVRSSATAEDLPTASFAGQQETFLNIRGVSALIDACRHCFASLFTNRAIAYRAEKGFNHFKVYLSVGVQKMVRSDKASAGVMFTLDTETGFPNVVLINASYGLGESVVQGSVTPDEFCVFKPTLKKNFKPIINKILGTKAIKIIYSDNVRAPVKKIITPPEERDKFCLDDDEILNLAHWGVIIEEHYSEKNKKWTPMDIEWAKDGKSDELFILQARPETVQSQKDKNVLEVYKLVKKGKVLAEGRAVGDKISQGLAHVIKDVRDISKFRPNEVLVTEMTDPDWVPAMRIAKAIVTNKGGRTSHAAIVSRELGLPCIVGTSNATQAIKSNQAVTVCCSEGDVGHVYAGFLKFYTTKMNIKKMPKIKTDLMINLGNPDKAFELSFLPNKGVGLAREEFIVSEFIKVHPMALVNFDSLKDQDVKNKIKKITQGYKDKKQFYIDKLARGVGMIAAAFYPKPVILRFSDFKTNEYANLIGGKEFEPEEENPMIGWRGASRYYNPKFKPAFLLECKAVKKVREVFGLDNLKVMIPFCRTTEEAKKVFEVMKKAGLKNKKDLEVYVMCEIPSNVVLADQFAKLFDGFSIGSNDLTQLALGVDRDSVLVSDIFDERNEAVKRLVEHVIAVAKKKNKKIGICGDAPSTFPEFAKFLIDCGIDSISLSPDAFIKSLLELSKYEKKHKKRK